MEDCSNDVNGIENVGYMDDGSICRLSNVSPITDKDCDDGDGGVSRLANGSGVAIIGGNAVVNYPQSPTPGEPKKDESEAGPCGFCCWNPAVLQRLASGRFFALFLGLLSLAEAGLTIGYIGSMVTTLELQFRFSSKLTGFVTSCYDIGTLLVILTSYFGGRAAANRPKWIAWSAWVMALGASVVTLPHFFISYDAHGNDTAPSVCHDFQGGGDEPICQPRAAEGIEGSALFFLIPGMLLIGAGSTATITLGTTYIDDFVRKKETPILLALVFSSTVVGPAVGFLVGGLFANYYVDFDKASGRSDVNISPSSPLWVGAWWLGFFCFAGLISILAFPVFAFPAKLEKPNAIVQDSDASSGNEGGDDDANVRMAFSDVSLAKIPLAVWGLVTNPVYMMINLAAAAEFSIVTGFVRFAPKFIQSQFGLTVTTANLLTGTLIPMGAFGVILGGLVLNRIKSTLLNSMTVLTACTILSWLLYGAVYIPGPCPITPLAGVTTSYRKGDSNWHAPTDPFNVNLTSGCNAPCQCDITNYRPICSSVDVSYFSPCFAGCQHEKATPTEDYPDKYEFYNCSCVREYNSSGLQSPNTATEPTVIAQAVTGLCEADCSSLAPFLVLLLLVVFVSSAEQMPALMAVLRCVKKEERPFAIGIQFVIFRLIGFIPSPIYYGAVIDSSCILWERECGGKSGACLLYSNRDFFYRFLWLSTGLKTIAVAMSVIAWLIVRLRHSRRADFTPSTLPNGNPRSTVEHISQNSSLDSAF